MTFPSVRRPGVKLLPAVLLTLCVGLPCACAATTDGLVFYAGFGGSGLAARVAGGDPEGNGTGAVLTEGRIGRGVRTGTESLAWRLPGNLEHGRGSLAFWVKRTAAFAGGVARVPLFESENFSLNLDASDGVLRFMTGCSVPVEGFKWDYSCQGNIAGGLSKWTHIAATWDSATGEKVLYTDGREIARTRTPLMRTEVNNLQAKITLGGKTPLAFDEIAVWDRVLTVDEIAAVVGDAPKLARAVEALPKTEAAAAETLTVGPGKRIGESSVVAPGEVFAADVPIVNRSSSPWRGAVKLALLDYDEQVVESGERTLAIAAGATETLRVEFAAKAAGIYKINVAPEGTARAADAVSFVVWPKAPALRDDSFFGVHVNSWSESMVADLGRLGFRWNRNHNMLQTTWWPRVQPEPGEFTWLHDPSLERNLRNGFQVMGQFFGTPYWAAAGGALKPQKVTAGDSPYPYGARPELKAYRAYVYETVKRYKDRIKVWEVWNEPDVSMFWNGTPEQFAELCKTSYEAAKEADPACAVFVAGFTSSWRWVERAAAAGALKYADGVSIHYYHAVERSPEEMFADLKGSMDFYRGMAVRYGRAPDMPIWQSEGGASATTWLRGHQLPGWLPAKVLPPNNAAQAAVRQVQVDVILQSLGFKKSFGYLSSVSNDYASLCDLDFGGAPKPAVVARAVLAREVDGHVFHSLVKRDEGRVWAGVYAAPDGAGSLAVAWAGDGGEVVAQGRDFGAVVSLADIMGVARPMPEALRLTPKPVYLRFAAGAAETAALWRALPLAVAKEPAALPASVTDASEAGAVTLNRPNYPAAAENPASLFTVDLRPFANMGFADEKAGDGVGGWGDEGDLNDLRTMPVGRQVFYAVPFDVIDPATNGGRAIITLRGLRVTPTLPEAVRSIPVNKSRVRALYFLHSAVWAPKGVVARYVIRYADGTTEEAPVTTDVNTSDWWSKPSADEESKVVPVKAAPLSKSDTGWRYLRVWEWQNPKPEVGIGSIDFAAGPGGGTAILIAVSGVTW